MSEELSLSDISAVTKGNDAFGSGSSWIVLILLFAMIWGGGGLWGNNGTAQANAATTADIQRAVDLNAIQQGQADISADIQRGIYEINGSTKDAAYNNLGEIRDVQSAVATGNANIINNLTALQATMQNCCCSTKQEIMENRYLASQNTNALMQNQTEQAQRIIDTMNANRMADMTQRINQLEFQNALGNVVRYPSATTYNAGGSCFSGSCGSI